MDKVLDVTPQEVEFVCESEMVRIEPRLNMPKLNFISGDFGPYRPEVPATAPLWLALTLKERNACRIIPPTWLDPEQLTTTLELEKERDGAFTDLPFNYLVIANLLLTKAHGDISDPHRVRTLIEDIENVRRAKLRRGLHQIQDRVRAVNLNNLSSMEINQIRSFFVKTLNEYFNLSGGDAPTTDDAPSVAAPENQASARVLRRFNTATPAS